MGNKRTLIQLGVSGAIAGAMLLAFVAVGGVGTGLAKGGGPNHGQSVRSVAMDHTMTCPNMNNSNVSNHGWCVRSAAHSGTGFSGGATTTTTAATTAAVTSAATTTATSSATGGATSSATGGTSTHGKSGTHHKSKTHHTSKTHNKSKTHGKTHH